MGYGGERLGGDPHCVHIYQALRSHSVGAEASRTAWGWGLPFPGPQPEPLGSRSKVPKFRDSTCTKSVPRYISHSMSKTNTSSIPFFFLHTSTTHKYKVPNLWTPTLHTFVLCVKPRPAQTLGERTTGRGGGCDVRTTRVFSRTNQICTKQETRSIVVSESPRRETRRRKTEEEEEEEMHPEYEIEITRPFR